MAVAVRVARGAGVAALGVLTNTCTSPFAGGPPAEPVPHRTAASIAAPEFALPAAPLGAPATPGPAPRARAFSAAAVNERCEACHRDIAAEWAESLHHASHTDPMYTRQFVREPFAFCTGCHAPEATPGEPVPEALHTLGVGCVTCHVAGDRLLAAPKSEGTERDGEHHMVDRVASFAGPAACAGCHEFAFPGPAHGRPPLLMQATLQEHAASAFADRSCASCHMPVVSGDSDGPHRSHAFAASRDEAALRSALIVEAEPLGGRGLLVRLRPGTVGHAFPMGDMLRRLVLVIDVLDAGGAVLQHDERIFARHFGFVRPAYRPLERVLVRDDRVGASPEPLVVRFTPARVPASGRVRYSLRYERVEDPGGAEGPVVVEGSVLLAQGDFALAEPSAEPESARENP